MRKRTVWLISRAVSCQTSCPEVIWLGPGVRVAGTGVTVGVGEGVKVAVKVGVEVAVGLGVRVGVGEDVKVRV